MGRREILSGALLAVFGLGGAALLGGVTTPTTAWTPLLVLGGLAAMTVSGVGLARLFLTTPTNLAIVATPPLSPPREFLPPELSASVLRDKVKGRTSIQVKGITQTYAGKWLRHAGEVRDVDEVFAGHWLLQLAVPESGWEIVGATFDMKWRDQLTALNKGDWVEVVGRLYSLDGNVKLEDCEIEHVGRPPAPAKKPAAPRRPQPKKPAS